MSLVKGPQLTTWAVRSLAGEPISVVRVRNLQAVTKIPADAWGRPGKAQPLLISVEVSFREQFSQASTQDRLGADTVNYGTLSKAILKTLQDFKLEDWNLVEDDGHLGVVVKDIWASLTGQPFEFRNYSEGAKRGVLDIETLRFMAITVTLPKASLLGQGVSLSASSVFGSRDDSASLEGHSTMLKLHGLRVPTLVGVNPNERLAKQVIIADIELDKFHLDQDYYTFVEDVAVKALENSSFETLEALGSHLGREVLRRLRSHIEENSYPPIPKDCQARIILEKPVAVPLADCPVVEVLVRDEDLKS